MTENELLIEVLRNLIEEQKYLIEENNTANDFALRNIDINKKLIELRSAQNEIHLERINSAQNDILNLLNCEIAS